MAKGVYIRTEKIRKGISAAMKGKIPHNKGKENPEKLKKLEKFKQGLPILCKKHGEHVRWRMHSSNNVQCKDCATNIARNQRKRDPLRFLFNDSRRHSKSSGKEFNIKLEDLYEILENQNGKCALSGMFFTEENLPSLDRINSSLGYVNGNIQFLTIKVNIMKSNLDQKEFINLCRKIGDQNESIREENSLETHQEGRQGIQESDQGRCEAEETNTCKTKGKKMKKETLKEKKHEAKESKAYEKKEDKKEKKSKK